MFEHDAWYPRSVFLYLFCFVLFCLFLSCFVLFCFVLFCFVLFCFVLFCLVLFCFVLFSHEYHIFCFLLISGDIYLSMNASKDVTALFKYLPFVTQDLLCKSPPFLPIFIHLYSIFCFLFYFGFFFFEYFTYIYLQQESGCLASWGYLLSS